MPLYEREEGPAVTRTDLPVAAPEAAGSPVTPGPAAEPVTFKIRTKGLPAVRPDGVTSGPDELTLWECSGCPGVAIWGDRLYSHKLWHYGVTE